jgi:hypothetical protein
VTLRPLITCPLCGGHGRAPWSPGERWSCPRCGGGGYVMGDALTQYIPAERCSCGLPLSMHPAREDCAYVLGAGLAPD